MPVILNTANLRVKTALIPIFASIIVVSFFLVLCGSGDADATIHSGIEKDYLIYDLDDGDNTATVRGLNATGESQDVVIPASVEYGGITYAVTSIGDHAFFDCSSLISVTIPESVISIGNGVFRNCYSLTGIYVDSGNANYTSTDGTLYNKIGMELIKCPARTPGDFTIPDGVIIIGSRAFEDCSSLTSVTIPYGVSSIDFCAFDGCSSLTSVTIPESVVSIGWDVFSDCSSLVSVTVPAGVTSIQSNTFRGCTSLTSVTMPENITSIGNQAFSGCSSLESITLPANLVSLGQGVFESCSSLVSVTIPASVTSIGENAFIRCTSMTAIDVDGSNTAFRSHDGVLYSKSGKDLISCPAGKSEVDLLDTATTIKSAAFLYSSIEFITITESVTHIEGGAFSSSSLTSVTIPANVTSVGGFAFSYCHALKTVHILGNTTLIENSAFRECSSLVSVTVSDSVTSIREDAFFLCDNLVLLGILGTSETDYSEIIAKFPHTISSVVFRSAEHVEIDTIASVYWINRIGVLGSSSDPVMGGQTFSDPEGTAITDAADLRGKMFVKADGWHQISTCSDPNVIYRVNGTVAEAIGLIDRSAAYSLIGELYNSGGIDYEVASISDNAFRESSLTGIGFLSLVAPISVGDGWITDTPSGITGHARNGSDFPVSGDSFHGLPMGENLALIPAGVKNLVYDGSEKTGVIPGTGCTVSGNTGVGAGTYEATATLTAGYIWSDGTMVDKSISWKIAKAPLSIIADDKNTTYSSEPPHYTVSYSGFVNGETDEVVNEGTATASYSRWDPVGFYLITAAGYTADNYEIIYFAGWLNVTEHSIDIPAVMTDMIYSGSEQTGVVPGTGYTVSGNTGVGAGTYEATATLTAGYIWSDGTMGNMTIFWNIAKAAYDMTGIAWSAASFVYDGSEKAVTISGLPAGVTVSAYTGNTGTDAGTYHANATFAYDSANYNEPSVADHEWIIALGTQTVSSEGYTGTYDGSAHGITVTQTGGTVTYSADGITYGADPLTYTGAGTYTVYFKVVKDNHSDYTGSETVTINKKELAKPTDDLSTFTYTGSEQTYAPAGFDISTMTVSGAARTDAGSQTVAVSITDKTNYQWTDATQTDVTFDFTIGPKEITVTPDVLSKVYGGSDPVFTYALSETVAVTGALSREPGEDVGTYAMTLGDLSAGGNYTLSLVPTNFAITKVPLTIKADDKAMTFGGAEPEYTVTYTGFVNGETQTALAGTLSVTSGYDSGVYAPTAVITASGLTSANYAITYETGVLTVSKIQVDAPTAVTGLAYSGTQQTGVAAAAGYTLTGNTGTDAGDYTATAALADGYIWSDSTTAAKTIPWNITPYVGSLIIKFESVYEGSPTEPPVIVKDDLGATLIRDVDYSVSYENNTGTGTATVIVTGMGNYLGTTGTSHFEVTAYTLPNNLGNVVIKDKATGKVLGPKDIVYQGQKLIVTPSSKIEGDYVIYDWQGNSIGSDGDYTVSGPVYGPFTVEGIPIPDPENVGEWGTTLGISLIILLILLMYVRYRMRSGS